MKQKKEERRKKKGRHQLHEGFTLVELMVALSLFVIVVLAAVSSLFTVNASARRVEAMRTVLDNINFAAESMSRTIRVSYGISCWPDSTVCDFDNFPSGGTRIEMNETLSGNSHTGFRFATIGGKGAIQKCYDDDDNGTCTESEWVAMTAPEVNIQNLAFYLDGEDVGDGFQPGVIIMMQGEAVTQTDVAPFALQTFVSARAGE